jgi:hypothetical protein
MSTIINDAVFWSFFLSTIVGCILKLSSSIYKSKCSQMEVCCIKIIRDTAIEEREHEYDVEHNVYKNENEK